MLQDMLYLITLDKPSAGSGQIIIYAREGGYETHWTKVHNQQEETSIVYSGSQLDQAWKAADEIRHVKCKEGYTFSHPWFLASLTAIPPNYLMVRKLECFSDQHKDSILFQELKKWRRSTASSANIPPYYIATDKLLYLLSTFVPHKPEELMQLPGIGHNKLEQYGSAILELTKNYPQAYPFPLDWIANRVSDGELATWLLDQNLLKQEKKKVQEKQEQEEKLRLLEAITDEVSIEEVCERLSLSNINLMKRIRQLSREGYDVLGYLKKEVEQVKDRAMIEDLAASLGSNRLKPIFEQLYGSSTELNDNDKGKKYNMIRLICTYVQIKSAA